MKKVPELSPIAGLSGFANVLTRREALQGALAFAATSMAAGCAPSSTSTSLYAPFPTSATPQPSPSGPITNATLTVTATSAGILPSAFAGLSYGKTSLFEHPYLFSGSNSNLIQLFKLLGPSVLRIGGNTEDQSVWTANGAGQTVGQIAPADVDALAAFLAATGWQCIYGINLGGTGPVPYLNGSTPAVTTAALAADEAAYVYSKLGSSLVGFEIGNEPDQYDTKYYSGATWNLSAYESLWSQFRAAIVARTPAAASLLTGPASASHPSTWTVPFGQWATRTNISLLTQHYYRADGGDPASTAALLLAPDPYLINELSLLKAGAQGVGIPFRMSECNSFYDGGASGVSNAYASSLWAIDFLFTCALGGAAGVNFHGGNTSPYTPIADAGSAVTVVRPEFYGILLFALAGTGTLYTTTLSAGGLNATAYAVKNSTGSHLVIVNKDLTQNLAITAQLPERAASATLLQMTQLSTGATGPALSATSGVTIQAGSVSTDGSFAPGAAYALSTSGMSLTCYVPALSAVLIRIA